MSVGPPFHPRTAPLNRKMQWREWSGFFASSRLRRRPRHRVQRDPRGGRPHRRQPAVQVPASPGRTRSRLVDRVITRDATKLEVGQVIYTPWCDEHGKVIDDGTVHRLDERRAPLDRRRPAVPLAAPERRRPRRDDRGRHRGARGARAPGPAVSRAVLEAATGESFADLRYFRRRASTIGGHRRRRQSRTGYTGDLGYELWIPADARGRACGTRSSAAGAGVRASGRPGCSRSTSSGSRPGSILLEVDYTSARHAMNPEQNYSPFEIGLGGSSSFDKARLRRPARAPARGSAAGGPARRLVGLQLDWYDIEGLYDAQGLPPAISPIVDRSPGPGVRRRAARSARRRRTAGARSSSRRSRSPRSRRATSALGTRLDVEWTVEGRRGRVDATVVELPFLDLDAQAGLTPTSRASTRIIDEHLEGWIEELARVPAAFPSEGGDRDNLRLAADWTADRLRRARRDGRGPRARRWHPAPGRRRDRRRAANAERVGHYDVQPARAARPVDEPAVQPRDPRRPDLRPRRDGQQGRVPAADLGRSRRGSRRSGRSRCRVRHLVEGEEETGRGRTSTRCSTCARTSAAPTPRSSRAASSTSRGRPSVQGGGKGIIVLELVGPDDGPRRPLEPVRRAAERRPADGRRPSRRCGTTTGGPSSTAWTRASRPPTDEQLAIVDAQDRRALDDIREDWQIERLNAGLDGVDALRALTFDTDAQHPGALVGAHRRDGQDRDARGGAGADRHPDHPGPGPARGRRGAPPPPRRAMGSPTSRSWSARASPPGGRRRPTPSCRRPRPCPPRRRWACRRASGSRSRAPCRCSRCARSTASRRPRSARAAQTAGHTRPTRTSGSTTSSPPTKMMGRFLDAFANLPEVPPVP